MFSYQLIDFPPSILTDRSRIDEIFRLVGDISEHSGRCNIAFLPDEAIRRLNHDTRGIDRTTDVLSFHYYDDFTGLSPDDIAGEIVLSESRILSQASEYGHTPREECEILIIHSLLHLLGHDHETDEEYADMWQYESDLRDRMGLSTTR